MADVIQGRTIGQLPNLTATQVDRLTDLIAIWRAGQPNGNRTGAITLAELQSLVSVGLLSSSEADSLYLTQAAGDGRYALAGTTGTTLPPLPANTNLSALRVVSRAGSGYGYSDPNSADSAWSIAGLTAASVNSGNVFTPLRNSAFSDSSWDWVRGSPIFLGTNGSLTQTPPSSGYLVVVAKVLDPQTVFIQIEEPIDL